MLGQWQQGVTWSSRFTSSLSYVAADGSSEVTELVGSGLVLWLGVLCEDSSAGSKGRREECDHVHHTVDRINDKTDGWYDNLLPNHTIVTATRSIGCVEGRARSEWHALEDSLPGFTAVIGPTCSNDVADVASAEWRASDGSRAVVISPGSSAPQLGDEMEYPNLARTVGTDMHRGRGFAEPCKVFDWDRIALLHDDSVWGTGGAATIKTSFEAINGEIITTVDFELDAFDAGTVHARELLARLAAASPRVIVIVTQLRVQRALCTQHTDSNIKLTGHT